MGHLNGMKAVEEDGSSSSSFVLVDVARVMIRKFTGDLSGKIGLDEDGNLDSSLRACQYCGHMLLAVSERHKWSERIG